MKNPTSRLLSRFQKKSFSLNELDKKLEKYLDFKHGFFIEAGANDGLTQSNTLFYERYKQWTGLLVEPIPDLASQCKINRPQCIVENYALVPHDFTESHIEMRYSNLMSLVKGAMKSEEAEIAHIEKGINSYDVKVPTATLTSILDRHSVKNIDLFSLDVEGFELSVLQGLDLDKYRPKWMLIETKYREEIDGFLSQWYEVADLLSHHDVLYKLR
jgi:FkbM family methyltransferase